MVEARDPSAGDDGRAKIFGSLAFDNMRAAAAIVIVLDHNPLLSPVGKHDDQVDVLGLIGRMLDEMVPGQSPKPPPKRRDRWDRRFDGDNEVNWKTV